MVLDTDEPKQLPSDQVVRNRLVGMKDAAEHFMKTGRKRPCLLGFSNDTVSDGRVTINPAPPSFSPRIRLKGLKIRGICFDIIVTGKTYKVDASGIVYRSEVGEKMFFDIAGKKLVSWVI